MIEFRESVQGHTSNYVFLSLSAGLQCAVGTVSKVYLVGILAQRQIDIWTTHLEKDQLKPANQIQKNEQALKSCFGNQLRVVLQWNGMVALQSLPTPIIILFICFFSTSNFQVSSMKQTAGQILLSITGNSLSLYNIGAAFVTRFACFNVKY